MMNHDVEEPKKKPNPKKYELELHDDDFELNDFTAPIHGVRVKRNKKRLFEPLEVDFNSEDNKPENPNA